MGEKEGGGVAGKRTNLGQPDISGHNLLPLMLWEIEKLLRNPPHLHP
jgi:hypothetical protein